MHKPLFSASLEDVCCTCHDLFVPWCPTIPERMCANLLVVRSQAQPFHKHPSSDSLGSPLCDGKSARFLMLPLPLSLPLHSWVVCEAGAMATGSIRSMTTAFRATAACRTAVRHASAATAAAGSAKMKHFSVRMTDSGVAIITYDRTDNKVNALNAEVGAELQQTLAAIVRCSSHTLAHIAAGSSVLVCATNPLLGPRSVATACCL